MARRRAQPPEPEYGLCEGAYSLDHASTLVRADVEATAGALVAVTSAHVWERDVAGREVAMWPRPYLVFRLAGHLWSVIVPGNDYALRWDQAGEAVALAQQLRTRVIALALSDTAGCCAYDLYEAGEHLEHWNLPDGEDEEFFSRLRPEGYWDSADGPYEYLDALLRAQKAYEPGWRFVDFFGARRSQTFGTGERWPVAAADGFVERVDWVAAPERKKVRTVRPADATPSEAAEPTGKKRRPPAR